MQQGTSNLKTEFENNLSCTGFYPLILRPTRVTKNTASLLDNIFTTEVKFRVDSGILLSDISDHFPIFAMYHYDIHAKKIKDYVTFRK